ncbi:MAG: hypothetical protein CVV57_10545 [Tenericutes bacterium HGW-Tenericutes-2]|jgi:hypothetical protein|nr:MAG: hypothetical protein CVV57_10545 [Tenericutes bacterium HGW-Tenericutes-2]PKL00446.1 MAG: hypothetical protein CVV56_06155 [Tenericutes bacterium HGW-Tenericutes-1]
MRKIDVFGRKLNLTRPFYLIILIFAIVLPGYFLIQNYFNAKMDTLSAERSQLQNQIIVLLGQSQEEALLEIDEMTPYLPTHFSQNAITSELTGVRDLAGLTLASGYELQFIDDATIPFTDTLPSTIKAVQINLSMTIDDASKVLDYTNLLMALDTFYYIESLEVTYFGEDQAMVELVFYTFYNEIIIS